MSERSSNFLRGRFGSPGFATARQIFESVNFGDHYTQGMSKKDALEFKFDESNNSPEYYFKKNDPDDLTLLGFNGGLVESIKNKGYLPNQPVHLATHNDTGEKNPQILEGHHRVAVMYKLHPDQPIPTRVWKNKKEMLDHFDEHGELEGT
jgi:hypothetical protein